MTKISQAKGFGVFGVLGFWAKWPSTLENGPVWGKPHVVDGQSASRCRPKTFPPEFGPGKWPPSRCSEIMLISVERQRMTKWPSIEEAIFLAISRGTRRLDCGAEVAIWQSRSWLKVVGHELAKFWSKWPVEISELPNGQSFHPAAHTLQMASQIALRANSLSLENFGSY